MTIQVNIQDTIGILPTNAEMAQILPPLMKLIKFFKDLIFIYIIMHIHEKQRKYKINMKSLKK